MSFDKGAFLEKISNRSIHIGLIGLGYVGLPLALAFAEEGKMKVTGFDVDRRKIERLEHGDMYIAHLSSARLRSAVDARMFEATSDFSRLTEPDALLIAVPTPLTPQREPDMTYVRSTAEVISKYLRRNQLVVLESTTYPGTTDELVRPILDRSGLTCGSDYLLAFSPEREDPGNEQFPTTSIPKIVGGVDSTATEVAAALYAAAVRNVVVVASARAAEATKLTENIFRSVNIALVNELKIIFDRMGIDIWDVLDAASTKPFGFMRFDPGPGLGGHCIPLDPFYLTWKAREFGISTRFVELAGEVNLSMPRYVFDKLRDALNQRRKAINGSRVLLLGIAYKKDIDDPRESPAFELIRLLLEHRAEVDYHDAHIPVAPKMRSWPQLPALGSVPLTAESIRSYDAVVIVTDHSAVDYELVAREASLIVDTRGVFRRAADNVVKA